MRARRVVVAGGDLLAETDRRAFGVVDDVVLDHPSARPMRADQADLIGGRRRVRAGRLRHLEAADRDVVDERPARIEARLAHVDLDEFRVRVGIVEIRPDGRAFGIGLAVPDIHRSVRVDERHHGAGGRVAPGAPPLGVAHLAQRGDLIERLAVEVHVARMAHLDLRVGVHGPVAEHGLPVRVVAAEERVGKRHAPHAAALRLPRPDPLRSLDDGAGLPLRRPIDDAVRRAFAAVTGVDRLAVRARVHDHLVAGAGYRRRLPDGAEGIGFGAGAGTDRARRNMVLRHRIAPSHVDDHIH